MMPSPLVGSGVDVRQTRKQFQYGIRHFYWDILSTLWKVNVPKRSYWVPFEVTVKFMLIPAHDPAAPHPVGTLAHA